MTRLMLLVVLGLVFNGASPVVAQVIAEYHLAIGDFVGRLGSATIGYGLIFAVLLRAKRN